MTYIKLENITIHDDLWRDHEMKYVLSGFLHNDDHDGHDGHDGRDVHCDHDVHDDHVL